MKTLTNWYKSFFVVCSECLVLNFVVFRNHCEFCTAPLVASTHKGVPYNYHEQNLVEAYKCQALQH